MTDTALSATQVEGALRILERERDALGISKRQERWLRWLRISAAVFIFLYVALLGAFFLLSREPSGGTAGELNALHITIILLSLGVLISLVMTLLLLIANAKLIITLIRQRRIVQRAGLVDLQASLWRHHRPARRFLDYCTAGGAILGMLFVLSGIVSGITAGTLSVSGTEDPSKEVFIMAGLLVAAGFVLIAPQLINRLRQRMGLLADVERLKQLLEQLRAGGGATTANVAVSRRDIERLSAIEAAQINRDRAQSINDRTRAGSEYTLLVSRNVHEARSSLGLEQRLKLEDSLENLLTDPRPESAHESTEADTWTIDVPETGMKLRYEIDKPRKQIKALSLTTNRVDLPVSNQGKGSSNA
jgi:hypothetical protein